MLPNVCLRISSTPMATSIPSTVQTKLSANVRPPRLVTSPVYPCPRAHLLECHAVWITEGNWEHFQEIVGFKTRKRKSSGPEGVAGSSEMQEVEADKGEGDKRRVNDTTTLRTTSSHGARKMRSSPAFSAAAQRCVSFSSVCHLAPWLILFHIFSYSAFSTVALIHPLCRLATCLVTSPSAQRLLLARRLLSPDAPQTQPTELMMSVSLTSFAITSASNQRRYSPLNSRRIRV
jgi:hypothetical protein